MKNTSFVLILIIFFSFSGFGQHALLHSDIKIDTSYTIQSAYAKHSKKYPNIRIAVAKIDSSIKKHQNLVYRTYSNNREMHLDLFEPLHSKPNKKKPCVVMIHGGGWISGDKSLLEAYALSLAEKGYVTLTVEYRFSTEATYPAAVIDINSALKWINKNAQRYHIDKKRINLMGSSAGGQLASLIAVTSKTTLFSDPNFLPKIKTPIHSLINIDGVIAFIHPISEEGGTPQKPSSATKWFGEHYTTDSTKWIEASALTYVGKNTPPTLFIASSIPRFNAGRDEMMKVLNKYEVYTEKHVFDDAPHSFWLFNPWFKPTLNWILDFLAKTN